ncbi:Effector protein PevD1 [Paramyrothecium foliicola]|nr:Effector protein PevD1 [Paramyrothecium foliicola]
MHGLTIATGLFAAFAAAAPANVARQEETRPSENINIKDFLVRKYNEPNGTVTINVVDFKLSGDDATDLSCTAQSPEWPIPSEVVTCGDSKYRFSLQPGSEEGEEFSLRVYHELGLAVGYWGQGDVPTYCRAGGNGAGDFVCTQVAETTIVIDNTPPPVNP